MAADSEGVGGRTGFPSRAVLSWAILTGAEMWGTSLSPLQLRAPPPTTGSGSLCCQDLPLCPPHAKPGLNALRMNTRVRGQMKRFGIKRKLAAFPPGVSASCSRSNVRFRRFSK